MTPHDILIFQILAGLAVCSLMVLIYFILRFLQELLATRDQVLRMAQDLEGDLHPILSDLKAGASHFRKAGEQARHGAEQLAEFSDQLVKIKNFTKTGAKGVWSMLAQAAGAFTKK
jgi:hypothetical protein